MVEENSSMVPQTESNDDKRRQRIGRIRLRAIRALSGTLKANGLRYNALHRELLEIRPPLDTIFWLEAIIAVAIGGRLKPAKTFDRLIKLRRKREKRGQIEKFNQFEELIREHLGGRMFTGHGYDVQNFCEMNDQKILHAVNADIQDLRDLGYDAFLNSGTLLGVVRDQKLIEHDDDIDLGLILQSSTEIAAAREWRRISKKLMQKGVVEKTENYSAILKLRSKTGMQVDLFPCWVSKGKVFVYPHTYGDLDVDNLLPLVDCGVSGAPIPADSEKMLELNYGKGWRSPDPYFKFPWASANYRFSKFLSQLQS